MTAPSVEDDLPLVRRLEAVGFRAWPASSVVYDGSWQVRLTGGHPSKRLNCIVPLDPSDHRDMDMRLSRARKRFEDHGRPLVIRETPLASPVMSEYLEAQGWKVVERVDVLTVNLTELPLPVTLGHLPSHDIGRFLDANIAVGQYDASLKPALAEILSSIRPSSGYFIKEDPSKGAMAVALCVQDNDLAGIMSFHVAEYARRTGIGTEILTSALLWARISGASSAWLQVLSDNVPALAMYERFGFRKAYNYRYWQQI